MLDLEKSPLRRKKEKPAIPAIIYRKRLLINNIAIAG